MYNDNETLHLRAEFQERKIRMKKIQGFPLPLGVTLVGKIVNFAIAVQTHHTCKLLLYKSGESKPEQILDMPEKQGVGEVRFLALEKFQPWNYEYNYLINDQVVVDPYAQEIAGKCIWGQKTEVSKHEIRGSLSYLAKEYEWEGDQQLHIPPHEIVAYSLHIRGYTMQGASGVKHKGTFQGVIEKIPYFKELGINQIQCMPLYEFEECMQSGSYHLCSENQINFWGYGEAYYFAPKSSYAASLDAVSELKDMIKACHNANIEVVLDMAFSGLVNTQLMEACLHHYIIDYHIDGFILNPQMISIKNISEDPLLKHTKIIVDQKGFQNVMRKFLKGDEGMVQAVMDQIRHRWHEDGVCQYVASHNGFTLADAVSYEEKHNEANGEQNQDGENYNDTWNCGVEGPTRKRAVVELRKKQIRNAFTMLLTAQGMPCILAGDEFGNSQEGNNNAYCQDNEIGWVNWKNKKKEEALFTFVKELIAFRKSHPVLHLDQPLLGADKMTCGIPDVSYHGESAWQRPTEVASRQLGVMYSGIYAKDEDCFIAYNMHWMAHSFALPSLPKKRKWYQAVHTGSQKMDGLQLIENQKEVILKERTIIIFIGR